MRGDHASEVVRDGRFDTVQGLVVPAAAGGWAYVLQATSSSSRSEAALLAGLHDDRDHVAVTDMSYAAYVIWQFDILRTALPTGVPAEQMVQANGALFEQTRRIDGYCYPVGAIPSTHSDWVQHFGDVWAEFARAKRRYDPAGILTPGQGIFGR